MRFLFENPGSDYSRGRDSLWALYKLLEILWIVEDHYTHSTGPVSVTEDNRFVKEHLMKEDLCLDSSARQKLRR
jgi:phosphoglucomutase